MRELGKRRALDKQAVADAAIALADEVGFDRLSLRGVADRLAVTPMALYNHISDKAELDAMVNATLLSRTMRDLDFAPETPWPQVIRETIVEMHRAFEQRPTLLPVFLQYPYHPKIQKLGRQMIAALERAGAERRRAQQLLSTLFILMVGDILARHHLAKGRHTAAPALTDPDGGEDAQHFERVFPGSMMTFDAMLDLQVAVIAMEMARANIYPTPHCANISAPASPMRGRGRTPGDP